MPILGGGAVSAPRQRPQLPLTVFLHDNCCHSLRPHCVGSTLLTLNASPRLILTSTSYVRYYYIYFRKKILLIKTRMRHFLTSSPNNCVRYGRLFLH